MKTLRKITMTVVVALLATIATTALAPDASAQVGEYRCAEGRLVGDQCELVGPAPFVTTACPQAADIVQPGCYRIALPLVDCTAPYVQEGPFCTWTPDPLTRAIQPILSDADCPFGGNHAIAVDPQFNGVFWEYWRCLASPDYICPAPTTKHVNGAGDDVECRLAVPHVLSYVCEAGYQIDGLLRCVHFVPAELHFPTWGLGGLSFG